MGFLGCHTEYHREAASTTDIYLSQSWRLEVQDQRRAGSSRGLSPWRVDGRLLPVSSRGRPSVCVCVLTSSSYKDTSPTGLGPILVAAFYFIHLFKGHISKYSCILGRWGSGFQQRTLGDTVQPITMEVGGRM